MRIIAGTARGRRLFSPGSKGRKGEIRPTSDRAREALFSILSDRVKGARVLDLFAGTGALGLEALSRGATSALFVDKGDLSVELLKKNIKLCGFWAESFIIKKDLTRSLFFLQAQKPAQGFSLVFADPPYSMQLAEKLLQGLGSENIFADETLLIVESSSSDDLPDEMSVFRLIDRRTYGEVGFWLYKLIKPQLKISP